MSKIKHEEKTLKYAADERIDEFARLVAAILRRLDKEGEPHRYARKSKQQEEEYNAASQ